MVAETNPTRNLKCYLDGLEPWIDSVVPRYAGLDSERVSLVYGRNQLAVGKAHSVSLSFYPRYLGGNPLTELGKSLFDGLASLERLWVNGCDLISLPVGLFDGLKRLEQLYLHNNKLGSLPSGVFGDDLEALHHLELRGNSLATLPAESFEKLQALSTLNLSANKISSLSTGHFPGNLGYLFLANNALGRGTIDSGAFEGLHELLTLTLSDNELGTLPAGLFKDVEALTVLGLGGNSGLQCVPSTAGSPSLAADKIILPAGFVAGVCSCPGDEVCDDCVDGKLGYICTGCGEKARECQLDRTCQECRIPANEQEQASWDACISAYEFRATCSALSATACCFDELSANACLLNYPFVQYSKCILSAVSENECTSLSTLSCIVTQQSDVYPAEQEEDDTSGGVRSKGMLVGRTVGSTVVGLVLVAGMVAWA